MTDWADFNLLFENLVEFFTGTYSILAVLLVALFMLTLMARGLDFRYAMTFSLPFLGLFVALGWFGTTASTSWIINAALIIVSFFYGIAVVRITT